MSLGALLVVLLAVSVSPGFVSKEQDHGKHCVHVTSYMHDGIFGKHFTVNFSWTINERREVERHGYDLYYNTAMHAALFSPLILSYTDSHGVSSGERTTRAKEVRKMRKMI